METPSPLQSSQADAARPLLLFAPYGDDRSVVARLLDSVRIKVTPCGDALSLELHLKEDIAGLLISQEGLTKKSVEIITRFLNAQSSWSELPIVLFVDRKFHSGGALKTLYELLPRSRLLILERPLRKTEFLSIIHGVLSARQNQFSLRDHIEFERELRREQNHRIKNIIATALALFQVSATRAETIETLRRDYEGRLRALGSVHSALFEKQSGSIPVQDLISAVTFPLADEKRFRSQGAPIAISGDIAETLALALHELATNSLKYGALSTPTGAIEISWRASSMHGLEIEWAEIDGPPVTAPQRRGYGTRFIEGALKTKGGNSVLHFDAAGLRAILTVPPSELDSSPET